MTTKTVAPAAAQVQAADPLEPLKALRQWIVVMLVPLANGKTTKLPVDYRTGNVCDAHSPAVWTDYSTAATLASRWGAGAGTGFVLTAADPFWCLDVDNCRTATGLSDLATSLVAALPDTVVEVSQSGHGLHIWGSGPVPPHSSKNVPLGIELYTESRFILTGSDAGGDMTRPCPTIAAIAACYFPPRAGASGAVAVADEGPSSDWRGPADDAELLRRAMRSQSAGSVFGGTRATFADLWTGDVQALAKAYPSPGSDPYDRSSADAALASHLAFWTGRDVARIERLMRQSALVRDKWDDRDDYLVDRTIRGACALQVDVLQDKPPEAPPPPATAATGQAESVAAPAMRKVEGTTFLSADQQAQLFAGCVYIIEQHRVLCPGGMLLKPDQFKARFGGYTFSMDTRNERTVRNAFEAFTESQVLRAPQANGTCFRPDLAPAALVSDAGRTRANTWWPIETPRKTGDASPFVDHLARLLPDRRDQTILLSWMACTVQFPGRKFQCAPFLQGVEGNGKTFFSRCLSEILGKRYTHWPDASKLGEKFNGWLYGRLLICVEDIHVGHREDVLERLKPWITGTDGVEIEGKGIDQVTSEIVANFIFNSNHKAGIRKTRNDRRYITFICPQQHEPDLARDGLTSDYFKALYAWAKGGGYAIVHDYLAAFPVPDEFRFDRGIRAPATSTTDTAIEASRSRADREILEAIEEGRPGFAGGFVSSHQLQLLLDALPPRERPAATLKDVMRALGYVPHPALPKGQTDNPVLPDGRRVTLYVLPGSEAAKIERRVSVATQYTAAQGTALLPTAHLPLPAACR